MANCNPLTDHAISCDVALKYGMEFLEREKKQRRIIRIRRQPLENMIIIDANALKQVVDYASNHGQYVGCMFGLSQSMDRNLTGLFFPARFDGTGTDQLCSYRNYSLSNSNLIRQTWIDPVDIGPRSYPDIVEHFFKNCE